MDLSIGELIFYAVVFWIGSQIVLGFIDGWQIVQLRERVKLLKEISSRVHQVRVEKLGDVEYWFDNDDNQFLGQGKTIDEIIDIVKSRFPNHVFLIEGIGGVARQTDWKVVSPEEFSAMKFKPEDL